MKDALLGVIALAKSSSMTFSPPEANRGHGLKALLYSRTHRPSDDSFYGAAAGYQDENGIGQGLNERGTC